MALDKKKIGLTFVQMVVGGCSGVLVGWILLTLFNFALSRFEQVSSSSFITGLLILIFFLITLGAVVTATAEGVRQIGRFIPKQISLRKIYEGAFLGICAAVAILSVTRGDWVNTLEDWSVPIRMVAILLNFLVVLPIKLVTFWVPSLLLFLIAAPIGATIGYNLPPKMSPETVNPKDSGGKKDKV